MGVVLRGDRDKPRAIAVNAERGCEARGAGGHRDVGGCSPLGLGGVFHPRHSDGSLPRQPEQDVGTLARSWPQQESRPPGAAFPGSTCGEVQALLRDTGRMSALPHRFCTVPVKLEPRTKIPPIASQVVAGHSLACVPPQGTHCLTSWLFLAQLYLLRAVSLHEGP